MKVWSIKILKLQGLSLGQAAIIFLGVPYTYLNQCVTYGTDKQAVLQGSIKPYIMVYKDTSW